MRSNRSFWVLAGLCSLFWVVAGVTLELGLTTVAPCWWAPVRHVGLVPSPACSSGSWLLHLTPLVPLMALAALAITTAVVTLVVLGRQVRATLRTRRRLVALGLQVPPALERGALAAGIRPGRLLIVESAHSYAFCLGVVRPLVVVSSALFATLDHEEGAAVLAHEAHHARARDPAKVAVARALAKGFFFVPVCQDLAAHGRLTCEVLADGDARARVGLPALARALRDLAAAQDSERVAGKLGCGMGDLGIERLAALATGAVPPCKVRRRSNVVTAAVAALALVALLGSWTTISSASTNGGTATTTRTCAAATSAPECSRP